MSERSIIYVPNGQINAVNDTYIGGGAEAPGYIPGMLGKMVELDAKQAAMLSSSVITLRAGKYQYVKTKASPTTALARGLALTWSDRAAFEVSVDAATDAIAGICAGIALNAITSGRYGWIQVDGEASVRFLSSGSPEAIATDKTTPAIGDSVNSPLDADNGRADVFDDADAMTAGTAATRVGRIIGKLTSAVGADFFAWVALATGDRNYGG